MLYARAAENGLRVSNRMASRRAMRGCEAQGHILRVQVKSTFTTARVIQLERAGPEAEEVSVRSTGFFLRCT